MKNLNISEYISTDNMLPDKCGVIVCENMPQADRVTKYIKGDTLVSNIRPYFKKIWYADSEGGCSNDVIVFRSLDTDLYDPKFLYYVISQNKFFDYMMAGSNGTKMPRGNKKTIPDFEVPDYEIQTQKRIADILSAYDNLIENNQKQIKLLEEMAQRLYKEWFVDLRFPNYENTKIVAGVPVGWEKTAIGNLIGKVARTTQIKSSEYLSDGQIPVVDQSRDFIAGFTNDKASIINSTVPTIIFGDHTRILKYIQFPFAKGADGTQLLVSNNEKMPQSLLYCSAMNVDLSNYHYARHFKYLKAEKIFVPIKEIAEEFDSTVSTIYKQIQSLRNKSYIAQQARDRLLPKLMSKELEV